MTLLCLCVHIVFELVCQTPPVYIYNHDWVLIKLVNQVLNNVVTCMQQKNNAIEYQQFLCVCYMYIEEAT